MENGKANSERLRAMSPGEERRFDAPTEADVLSARTIASRMGLILKCKFSVAKEADSVLITRI